jgi:hypothetical protein
MSARCRALLSVERLACAATMRAYGLRLRGNGVAPGKINGERLSSMNIDQIGEDVKGNRDPVAVLLSEMSAAGIRIQFFPGKISPRTRNGAQFATADFYHVEKVWRIYYPADCNTHQVYHELLHVRWSHLKNAPMLCAQDSADVRMRSNIEELNNDFDHAHIVCQEIAAYPEAVDYWVADFSRRFPSLSVPLTDATGTLQTKLDLLRGWMVLSIALPQSDVTERYRKALRSKSWFGPAQIMARKIQAAGTDKATAVEAFRNALDKVFPPKALCCFRTDK